MLICIARRKEVVVHYSGYLANGTKFDSLVDRNEALAFPIGTGQVIKGWDEGVMSMKAGGLSNNSVRVIQEDSHDAGLWIGTYG